MRSRKQSAWWGPRLCIIAGITLAVGATLSLALPVRSYSFSKDASPNRATQPASAGAVVIGGTGIPANFDVPVAPPVYAYRASRVEQALKASGATELSVADLPAGGVAAAPGDPCTRDIECEDCNPCTRDRCRPGTCSAGSDRPGFPCSVDAECANGTCTPLPDPGPTGRRCIRVFDPAGEPGDANDGFTCNGIETCDGAGNVVVDLTPCAAGETCDPNRNVVNTSIGVCRPTCAGDPGCQNTLACDGTGETCSGGLCSVAPRPCGTGTPCEEGNPIVCGFGRCCSNTDPADCTRTTLAGCGAGRNWLGVGDREGTPPEGGDDNICTEPAGQEDPFEGEDFQCPRYASGVSPSGAFTVRVGPVGAATCEPTQEIGDDYTLNLQTGGNYFELTTFRFVGGYRPGVGIDRMRITFYDAAGTFIEDTITNSSAVTGIAMRTIVFAEKPVIPQTGWVTIKPASQFAPDGKAFWMATDATDVGTNDATGMWYDGRDLANDVLGRCNGGDRNGEACDRRAGNADCPNGGTCVDVPDILAFELVGNEVAPPLGACCITDTGACQLEFPWVCDLAGDVFQGIGSLCGVCDGDDFTQCDENADCNIVGGPCIPFLPACTNTACCNNTTGACTSVQGGTCSVGGAPCLNDSQCVSGTCQAQCPGGTTGQGFGSKCEPNCCDHPYTGSDDCETALLPPSHVLTINPDPNITTSVTMTGDNTSASYPDSCGILTAALGAGDQGWWERFSIDKCANVRVDFCCTDPVHQPAWGLLVKDCPCSSTISDDPVPGPIGQLESSFERGAPFCYEDNLWSTFGPLPAGEYYYAVYSAIDGHFGQYQLHVTAAACPRAACCIATPICKLPDGSPERNPNGSVRLCPGGNNNECGGGNTCASDCVALNEPDCAASNGYWLGFRNLPPLVNPVVDCTGSPCALGSCCLGTTCRDEATEGIPCDTGTPSTCMDESLCTTLDGRYVGGAQCDFLRDPCPACEVEATDKCQVVAGGEDYELGSLSDNAVLQRAADDFKPQGTSISTLCITGQYVTMDSNAPDVKCADDPGLVDDFHVRVYANNPATNLPGALIGESDATVALKGLDRATLELEWHKLQLTLDAPIGGLTIGQCHWLEVTNNTVVPDGTKCHFYWAVHKPNGGAHEGNLYSAVAPAGAGAYPLGGHRAYDLVFCLDIPFEANGCGDRSGGCCNCAGTLCTDNELGACNALGREWHSEDDCATLTCSGTPPTGDDCATDAIPVGDGTYITHTQCATTDGPPELPGAGNFDKDLWFEYSATCTGTATVSMCGSALSYDSFLAVYRNKAPGNPKVCTCPTTNANLWPPGDTNGSDEDCHQQFIGPGFLSGRVDFGDCLLVRAGGFGGASGDGSVTISCVAASCVQSNAPVAAQGVTTGGGSANSPRNRFLSFSAGDPGRSQAIRIKLKTLPAPWNVWNNQTMWVQAPQDVCETSGVGPGGVCAVGVPTFKWAKTNCAAPFYRPWANDGVIHVSHPGFVPGGQYEIQVIDDSCAPNDEANYSPPLAMTNARWGDTVGPFRPASNDWTIPDNSVQITADVTAGLNKFGNRPGSPIKVRVDVEPCSVDLKINITDVTRVLDAFRNLPFPFSPTGGFGCSNADPCSYSAAEELAASKAGPPPE